jgi:two-component system response regulator
MSINNAEILLVEDSADDADLTVRALKKVNLANKLVHLEDGQEALDYLFGRGKFSGRDISSQPKVILLDIKMPRVDGIEVLRQIKANEITRMIPVVIMTSSSEEQDLIATYSLGVNSYVVKPVNFEGFAKAVSDLGLYWLLTNQTLRKSGKN